VGLLVFPHRFCSNQTDGYIQELVRNQGLRG
jgi:hypothetical protein